MGNAPAKTRSEFRIEELHFLDLVLIRNRVVVDGTSFDKRVKSTIAQAVSGVTTDARIAIMKWNRVGILQPPTYLDPSEWTYDNIQVTHATEWGIISSTLRKVCDEAEDVAIRQVGAFVLLHSFIL
jgi:hypothetical protein